MSRGKTPNLLYFKQDTLHQYHQDGEIRKQKRFALFPVKLCGKWWIWLRWYEVTQEYGRHWGKIVTDAYFDYKLNHVTETSTGLHWGWRDIDYNFLIT